MGRRIQIFHLKKIGPAYTNREPVETVLKRAFECGHRLKVAVEIFPPKKTENEESGTDIRICGQDTRVIINTH